VVGVSWELRYRDQVDRIKAQVRATVPEGSRVLVVSRGDEDLLRLGRRVGEHFPQTRTGLYAGHYPADGHEAVAHLRELRDTGAEYLVVPAEARWWLEHYPELSIALEEEGGELLPSDPETALIYALSRRDSESAGISVELEADRVAPSVASLLRALLPERVGVVLIGVGAEKVDLGDRPCRPLSPYPVETAIERARADCAAGARFVVLIHPDEPSEALDGGLRAAFAETMRPVCAQRLAEVFEVEHG
jgi:hypothetical protein